LTLFSASFPRPVQGVSHAGLNALAAAPGRQIYRQQAVGTRVTVVFRAVRAVVVSPGGADHREVLAGCSTLTFLSILPTEIRYEARPQ
jgi:hypothetical protein